MQIILQNFRCYGNPASLFNIEPHSLTLLQGKSGDGKSTLLSAIQWCLFGGLKGANLKSIPKTTKISAQAHSPEEIQIIQINLAEFAAGSASTVVVLIFSENLTVRRRSAATSGVEVVISKLVLKGDEATAYITQHFGQKKQWSASSYLPQSTHHALLTDSNADKFNLLKEITFGFADSPDSLELAASDSTDFASSPAEKWTSLIASKTSAARTVSALASAKVAAMRDLVENVRGGLEMENFSGEDICSLELEIVELESRFIEKTEAEKKRNLYETRMTELTRSKVELEEVFSKNNTDLQRNVKLLERRRRELADAELLFKSQLKKVEAKNELDQAKLLLEQTQLAQTNMTKQIFKIQNLPKLTPTFLRFSNLFQTIFQSDSTQPTPVNPMRTVSLAQLQEAREWLLVFADLNISEPNTPAKIQQFVETGTHSLSFQIAEWKKEWEELCGMVGVEVLILTRNTIATFNNLAKYQCLVELENDGFFIGEDDQSSFTHLHLSHFNTFIEFSKIPMICEKWEKIRAASESKQFRKLISGSVDVIPVCTLTSSKTLKFKLSDIEKWEKLKRLPSVSEETAELLEKIGVSKDRKNLIDHEIPEEIVNSGIEELPDFTSCSHIINMINSLPGLQTKLQENESNLIKQTKTVKQLEKKFLLELKNGEEDNDEQISAARVTELAQKFQHTDRENIRLTAEHKSTQTQLEKIEKQLSSFTCKNKDVGVSSEVDLSRLPSLRAKLSKAIQSREWQQSQQKYELAVRDEKTALSKEHALTVALDWLSKSTILALSETVAKINEVTNSVLSEMFVEPISIELSLLHKSTSSSRSMNLTSTTGNSVSLTLVYKGQVFNSFDLLSGGEKDRLSLALTIASAVYTDSKLVLLDECLGSLDDGAREMCFEVIRKYLVGRTVVHVSHTDSVGEYESHVDV